MNLANSAATFTQAAFERKSAKTDPGQFDLALKDLETAIEIVQAEEGDHVAP
ncbi:hypothetical protein GFB56_05620 [Ensifer sp. T173]|uniref:Uncharacterized protein n=1 Tax=Ensifer canadensis TaxID=555315 RepID=A0AAW4FKR4_9HYPH|nr:hypothetical protein [Ensifer canadensis]MBM3090290.1 hypothetical protein [Ensifer canadensis]UBI80323.1 hypothetical protein J3R84_36140 [Ensifer canadensis]